MTEQQPEIQEAEVISVESTINNALVKQNITDKVIAEFKQKYGSLTIKDINDREGYRDVVDARKEVKQLRVLAVKICKHGREEAVRTQKAWIAKEKEVVDQISEIENYLQDQQDSYEEEKARLKREEEERLENQRARRTVELTNLGAQFIDGSFVLDDVQFDLPTVRECDESLYQSDILPKFQEVFNKKEAARIEQERKEKEEKERAEQQAKELAALKEHRTTARGKELIAAGYEWQPAKGMFTYKDIDGISIHVVSESTDIDWATIIEGAKTMVEEDATRLKELEEKQKRYDKRVDQLSEMMFVYVKKDKRFKAYHVLIDDASVMESDEQFWEQWITLATEEIKAARDEEEKEKTEKEKQRVEQERINALVAIRKGELRAFDGLKLIPEDQLGIISETDYLFKLGEAKESFNKAQRERFEREEKAKKEKEEQERKEKEENMKDKDKFHNFIKQLNLIPVPEFRSGQYRKKGSELNNLLNQINAL